MPDDIKIINPYQYLFTISEKIIIELEVKIEYGKSYMLATDRKLDNKNEFFPIDANFSPILNVDYYIQSVTEYIEQSSEELHLIIYTNGTLLPQEALLLATNNLSELLLGCRNIESLNSKLKKIVGSGLPEYRTEKILQQEKNKNLEGFLVKKKFLNYQSKESLLNQTLSEVDDINGQSSKQSNLLKNNRDSFGIPEAQKNLINEPQTEHNGNLYSPVLGKNFPKIETESTSTNSNFISTPTKTLDLRTIDIEITCLPPRILTILRKANIFVMADLLKYSLLDLEKIKGLGPISITKIKTQVDLFFEAISL